MGLVFVGSAVGIVAFKVIIGHNVCACGYVIAPKTSLQLDVVYGVVHPSWYFRLRSLRNEPVVERNAIFTVTLLKSIEWKHRSVYLSALSTVPGQVLEDEEEETKQEGSDDKEE